ncbi:MAG: AraC family transcriptional regulator [Proteobacteria bacterium]|nr:AraC family transcriptional regulator [Pseudomonadota bacterium]
MVTQTIPSFLNIKGLNELEHFVGSTLNGKIVDLPKSEHMLDVKAYKHSIATTDLWFCSYGAPITLQFPESDYFRIQFHVNGQGSTKIRGENYSIKPTQAVISKADAQIQFGPNFQQKVLRVSLEKLTQKAFALTGMPLPTSLEFDSIFDHKNHHFERFKQTFDFIEQLIGASTEHIPAFVLAELEQTLLTSILCSISNSWSSILERQSPYATPREIRQVEAYIEANWNQPILIEDLVAITNCSTRSIFSIFKQHRGYSPLNFVKQVRLRHARQMLLNAEDKTVTRIALECGFLDHGRFSRDYAKAFGESPSQTLRMANRIGVTKHGINRLKVALTN